MFIDPQGLVSVDALSYLSGFGATINENSKDYGQGSGNKLYDVTLNNKTYTINIPASGLKDDSVLNNLFGIKNPFIPSGKTEAVFVGAHEVERFGIGTGNFHTSTIIFIGYDSKFFTKYPDYFVNSHYGMLYTTLGAKSWLEKFPETKLEANANSKKDIDLGIKVSMQYLHSGSEVVQDLFTSFEYFKINHNSSLTYWFFPGTSLYQFNSNSFTSGLLNSVGFVTPNLRPEVNVTGWERPVPERYFGGPR
jgi:hypothetical protein